MTDSDLVTLIGAWFVGWSIGPAFLLVAYTIGDVWRAWRWRRNAPAREVARVAREVEMRTRIEEMNARAIANGSDERIILAGIDCLVVSYRSRSRS